MTSRAWQARGVRVAVALLAVLLAGCASTPPPAPSDSPDPSTKRTQQFDTTFESRKSTFHIVGKDSEKSYGWSKYVGRADFLDNRFRAEMLVANDYVKGNGTFEGFVTLMSPEGDIGLRITGVSTEGAQGPGSAYSGETEVIGGTGEYDTLAGRGRFTGERTGATGTPISVEVSLELINPK
jgi:hypothetical protein